LGGIIPVDITLEKRKTCKFNLLKSFFSALEATGYRYIPVPLKDLCSKNPKVAT
jgi:hypothetical protein